MPGMVVSSLTSPSSEAFSLSSLERSIISIEPFHQPQIHVAIDFYLDREVASNDIGKYTEALEKIFSVGSKLIEDRCAQALFSNLKIDFKPDEKLKLSDYVRDAKKKWLYRIRTGSNL
jgi:hypothetical protein